jgi:hypothetical protein
MRPREYKRLMRKFSSAILLLAILFTSSAGQQTDRDSSQNPSAVTIARLRYDGGGNWYWGRSAIPNMHNFLKENTSIPVNDLEINVRATDTDLFKYPFLFLTGHGNIVFSDDEAAALRIYLENGGFLFANDSYGLAGAIRREMKKIFPDRELLELPFSHPIYHSRYDFPNGLPKIHKHDEKPPQGFAIIIDDRACVFFAYESDIGDGWEDPEVYNDPPEKRLAALRMGANLVTYALTH